MPSDAGPAAGPAVLKAHCRAVDVECQTIDLNIRFIRLFKGGDTSRLNILGDHAKDPLLIRNAREYFCEALHLPTIPPDLVPSCLDPRLTLPHSFDNIYSALDSMEADEFWKEFLNNYLFNELDDFPDVLGLSIMGPSQVLPALLIARLAQKKCSDTIIIGGGSHITLKASDIVRNSKYNSEISQYLPGHSEHTLAEWLAGTLDRDKKPNGFLTPGTPFQPAVPLPPQEWLPPLFESQDLNQYPKDRVSIPLQLSRGCAYSRCAFCTYPVVEESCLTDVARFAQSLLCSIECYGIRKVSFKDSLFSFRDMMSLAKAIGQLDEDWEWSATVKIDAAMDHQAMSMLYAGGCRTLEYGVETIHTHLQSLINKVTPLNIIERGIEAAVQAGISVVINLIYGMPSESESESQRQLEWFLKWRELYPDKIIGSHNMLEVNQGAIMAKYPDRYGIQLGALGPWAFNYAWSAPKWSEKFHEHLQSVTVRRLYGVQTEY